MKVGKAWKESVNLKVLAGQVAGLDPISGWLP